MKGNLESRASFSQQRVWFIEQLEDNKTLYNIPLAYRLAGNLDSNILKRCFTTLAERHQIIRTNYFRKNGEVWQRILDSYEFPFEVIDIENSACDLQKKVRNFLRSHTRTKFDLNKDIPMRVKLLRLKSNDHILLVNVHHIAFDGWSIDILLNELSVLYTVYGNQKNNPLEPLHLQYKDYAAWQKNWLQGEVLNEQLQYWKKQLRRLPNVHQFPLDRVRLARQSYEGGSYSTEISENECKKIYAYCRKNRITLYIFMHTIFTILLHKYSNSEDIVVGTPVSGRIHKEMEGLLGFFVNTIILRSNFKENPTIDALIKQNREVLLSSLDHQYLPFELLVEELNPVRNPAYNPLFQIMFSLYKNKASNICFGDIELTKIQLDYKVSKHDISLMIEENTYNLVVHWQYSKDLFDLKTIERLALSYKKIWRDVLDGFDLTLSHLSLLDKEESKRILSLHKNMHVAVSNNSLIHSLFEKQVKITPDSVAVVAVNQNSLKAATYNEVNQRANKVASCLIGNGVIAESIVGVFLDRSIDLITALLGILKAGGAYVPLDPKYPPARTEFILVDSQAKHVITCKKYASRISTPLCKLIFLEDLISDECIDRDHLGLDSDSRQVEGISISPSNLAYVIYTSGSTGKPKGVMIEHRNTFAFLQWVRSVFDIEALRSVLASTSICFDLSIFEIFAPLSFGGKVVLVDDVLSIIDYSNMLDISLINTVPSALSTLAKANSIPKSVSTVNIAGESLKRTLVDDIFSFSGIKYVYNLYGPSEDTTYSTFTLLNRNETEEPTIGRPIAGTQVYILDTELRPVPIGVRGEIYLAGSGLSRGYLNNQSLTQQQFISAPFISDDTLRLYKTGDLARWRLDENIEYLGRSDHQIKLNGYRIELNEVEQHILESKLSRDVVVAVKNIVPIGRCLIAYLIPADITVNENERGEILTENLHRYLANVLPSFQRPKFVMLLKEFPLTPNGKLDRDAFPLPKNRHVDIGKILPPNNNIERKLIDIWKEILGLDIVGVTDNFFDLGGHSMLIVGLREKIVEAFNIELKLIDLYEYPNIHALSDLLIKKTENSSTQVLPRPDPPGFRSEVTPIAIIGMAGKFPNAENINTYWKNIIEGLNSIEEITDAELISGGVAEQHINNSAYVKRRMKFDKLNVFDYQFFDIPKSIAGTTDPQNRLLLQCAYHALESAGYLSQNYSGNVGVFVGKSSNLTWITNLQQAEEASLSEKFSLHIQNDRGFLAQYISYHLNLNGPSINISTACSTSLVAVQEACLQLCLGHCDIALAGGASISATKHLGYLYQKEFISSVDGYCKPFDKGASGSIAGNGVGLVVLKPLKGAIDDGDMIHSVIRGWGINNDGSNKVGFTAPSVEGQSKALISAYTMAGIDPSTVGYIETHGSGTPLGDVIEIASLKKAFSTISETQSRAGCCALGAVKANIGHLDVAAGIAGLIKVVNVLSRKQLPPVVNFRRVNTDIDLENTPFYIPTKPNDWKATTQPRRAGISSFGIGGTNVHLVLEEYSTKLNDINENFASEEDKGIYLLTVSAKTERSLSKVVENLIDYINESEKIPLMRIAHTLQHFREAYIYRFSVVCRTKNEAVEKLSAYNSGQVNSIVSTIRQEIIAKKLILVLPGLYPAISAGLTQALAHEKEYVSVMNKCMKYVPDNIYNEVKSYLYLSKPAMASATVYKVERNNKSHLVENVSSFIAMYSLIRYWLSFGINPNAIIGFNQGEWLAVCLADVINVETAIQCIIGDVDAGSLNIREPEIPVAWNMNEGWVTSASEFDINIFSKNNTSERDRQHYNLLNELDDSNVCLYLDTQQSSSMHAEQGLSCTVMNIDPASMLIEPYYNVLALVGNLWNEGIGITWNISPSVEKLQKVVLPGYPFEETELELETQKTAKKPTLDKISTKQELTQQALETQIRAIWVDIFGSDDIEKDDNFFQIGGDSLQALRVVDSVEKNWSVTITVDEMYLGATIQVIAAKVLEAI